MTSPLSNMNHKPQTIKELEEKAWFRLLKVIYIGLIVLASLFILYAMAVQSRLDNSLEVLFFLSIIFGLSAWVTRGVFFYVIIGKFNPPNGKPVEIKKLDPKYIHRRIKEAGWAIRMLGRFLLIIGGLGGLGIVIIALNKIETATGLIFIAPLIVIVVGLGWVMNHKGNELYKKDLSIEDAQHDLRMVRNVSFFMLFGGGIGGLLLLMVLWYTLSTLSAINKFLIAHDNAN